MEARTRFAPSPTGYMHIGNLRSALFEYLVAKSMNGTFVLRIEDTDQKRTVDGAVEFIYDTLKLCNINIDEGPLQGGEYGPYIQSKRLNLYQEYAKKLVEEKHAYCCFCSEERLNKLREEAEIRKVAFMYDGCCKNLSEEEVKEKINNGEKYVIRQLMPKEGTTSYNDLVYGKIDVENMYLEDQILLKSDGFPTYNFANVIDDHLMNITHVVRGNEYLSSTPKYLLLYKALGWESPLYIHLPHIIKEGGKKISKREGDASFMDLYNDGYLPEAVINYLALLGWSPNDNQEIFTMDELIKTFDFNRINHSPAVFDIKKLNWMNSIYIKKMELEDLYKITLPYLKAEYHFDDSNISHFEYLVRIYKDHLSYGKEIVELTKLFFTEDIELNDECLEFLNQEGISHTLEVFKEEINNIEKWDIENINIAINNCKEKSGSKGKMLYMPIRIKVSGLMHGPELPDTIYLLGKEKIINRLK